MVGGRLLPLVDRCPLAGGRFELAMEPTAIGLVSLKGPQHTKSCEIYHPSIHQPHYEKKNELECINPYL